MTLGNSPQPLTRRQLRELARENEPATAETDPSGEAAPDAPSAQQSRHTAPGRAPVPPAPVKPAADKPATVKPAADKPATVKPAADKPATVKPATVKPASGKPATDNPAPVRPATDKPAPVTPAPAQTAVGKPAPAPLPIPDEGPATEALAVVSAAGKPGQTLTRRELRALQAAASASAEPATGVESAPAAGSAGSVAATSAGTAAEQRGLNLPLGHWSVDREDDSHIQNIGRRDDQTFDDLVGSGMGAGGIPTTTNALILPAIPRQGGVGPMTSTGEIMITGSIDLPRSLGATGQHPNLFDSSEMDRMLDQLDEAGHHNDVAPVSASRAVSTHTSTRGVMTPPRKRGASLPTVLAITAAVLAIGVLSLFVVGYAFNIY